MKDKDIDHSKDLIDSIKELSNKKIRWGAIGQNNVEKIVHNEYGTENIPERPAFRMTFASQDTINKLAKSTIFAVEKIIEGKGVDESLNIVGEVGLAELKKTFRSNIPPANAPSTIKKKGTGKNTLFDTGELVRSLGYEIA